MLVQQLWHERTCECSEDALPITYVHAIIFHVSAIFMLVEKPWHEQADEQRIAVYMFRAVAQR